MTFDLVGDDDEVREYAPTPTSRRSSPGLTISTFDVVRREATTIAVEPHRNDGDGGYAPILAAGPKDKQAQLVWFEDVDDNIESVDSIVSTLSSDGSTDSEHILDRRFFRRTRRALQKVKGWICQGREIAEDVQRLSLIHI